MLLLPHVPCSYERVSRLVPEHDAYKLAWAQALQKSGAYEEAERVAVRITDPALQHQVATLLVVNAYEQDDLAGVCSSWLVLLPDTRVSQLGGSHPHSLPQCD